MDDSAGSSTLATAPSAPSPEQFELSLFGPGYGEAVALHVGLGNWILVDSCLEPDSGEPACLHYLRKLGVDVATQVKLIVVTHWHDDHIRGISKTLKECSSALPVVSSALLVDEFLQLCALYSRSSIVARSGIDEFREFFEILQERKEGAARFVPAMQAIANRLLYRETLAFPWGSVPLEVFSLSPSDWVKMQSTITFMTMLPRGNEPKKRLPSFLPNHASVVVWVRLGGNYVLLGSDLENAADPTSGWSVIVDHSLVAKGRAFAFKVPHHGSVPAHHDGVWTSLLADNPVAALTPFALGSVSLPGKDDVSRITALTANAYITAEIQRRRRKLRNRIVREFFEAATKSASDVDIGWGHIRVRRSLRNESEACSVSCFGDATQLAVSRIGGSA